MSLLIKKSVKKTVLTPAYLIYVGLIASQLQVSVIAAPISKSEFESPRLNTVNVQPDAIPVPRLSFGQAEQYLKQNAYTIQASNANLVAAQNQAEANAQLWRPVVSLDANAIKYRTEVDIPLNDIKATGENAANQAFAQSLNNLPVPLPDNVSNFLTNRFSTAVSGLFEQIPSSSNVVINDKLFRPTISAVMPIYAGGSIQAAQNIARIGYEKAQLNHQQVQDQQTLKLAEAYFGQQLAICLTDAAAQNLNALQQHLFNAQQLEQQGMISRSQRLQVEVATQAAQRQYDQASSNENASRQYLQQLLQQPEPLQLTTPLFVQPKPLQPLDFYLSALSQQSPQLAQLQKDQQLAAEAVQVTKASLLPSAYVFGQQTLNKNDWLVGVGAHYTLLASTDRKKLLYAAQARENAVQSLQLQAQQDLQQLIRRAYFEADSARKAFISMQTSITAAQENLRVQQVSFREGETTATFVNDAVNALTLAYTDQATAAYRYDMALVTLLAASGQARQFSDMVNDASVLQVQPILPSGQSALNQRSLHQVSHTSLSLNQHNRMNP